MRAGGSGGPGEAGQGEPHTGIGELVGCGKEQRTVGAAWCGTVWTHLGPHVRQDLVGFFQCSGNAGPLKFKVFVELHQPAGLLGVIWGKR